MTAHKLCETWLPDGYIQIFISYVFDPSGFRTMALLHCAAKLYPFLSLDCARVEGSNFAIWQPLARDCSGERESERKAEILRDNNKVSDTNVPVTGSSCVASTC